MYIYLFFSTKISFMKLPICMWIWKEYVDIEFDFDKKKYNTNVWQVIFTAVNFYEFIGKLTISNLII